MITEKEKKVILKYAKKYHVSSVILFGSSIEKDKDYNDIDIGVKGINPKRFFDFYGELLLSLPKNIDVVDLKGKSLFNKLVEESGIKIYGWFKR